MSQQELFTAATSSLSELMVPYGFEPSCSHPPDFNSMGGWYSELETSEFVIAVSQDRSSDVIMISIGSKLRRKPRAHMRGPWSLSHLRGYLEKSSDHYLFESVEEQLDWLRANVETLLDTSLLNSDEFNAWAVNASRRMLG